MKDQATTCHCAFGFGEFGNIYYHDGDLFDKRRIGQVGFGGKAVHLSNVP
jgi:hypothetical protein